MWPSGPENNYSWDRSCPPGSPHLLPTSPDNSSGHDFESFLSHLPVCGLAPLAQPSESALRGYIVALGCAFVVYGLGDLIENPSESGASGGSGSMFVALVSVGASPLWSTSFHLGLWVLAWRLVSQASVKRLALQMSWSSNLYRYRTSYKSFVFSYIWTF